MSAVTLHRIYTASNMRRIYRLIPLALLGVVVCTTLAHSQSLDLQERCASLARKTFEDFENEAKANQSNLLGTKISGADYQTHYNTKLKKCMILIAQSLDFSAVGTASNLWFLEDAIERRGFATYSEGKLVDPELAKQTGQRNLQICELTPSGRQKTLCKTREEFDAFVAEYMEE